jgi:hypothetical protein
MLDEIKHREYRAKAEEAERLAARSIDPSVKESWQKIAASYRRLEQPNSLSKFRG